MKRLIHLSDLHFGRVNPDLEAPLLASLHALAPDLVVVSGDLTQRARPDQFKAARAFLDRIAAPVLAIPGNHDTPLYNIFLRLFSPFARYKRYISQDLEPVYTDQEMIVMGLNTVNPFAWQRGRLGREARARVSQIMAQNAEHSAGQMRIVVLHHPPEQDPTTDKKLMKGAREALIALSHCGADVVLSGHLHQATSAPFRAAPDLLFVEAGTGLSTRLRGTQGNTFNQIDIEGDALRVVTWSADAAGFSPDQASRWRRVDGRWQREA